jgi:hypothetical protein
MTETMEGYVRAQEAWMKDKGEWPEEPPAQEQLRDWLRNNWRAGQPVEQEPFTARELELLTALRAAYRSLRSARLEKTPGYQAARKCLAKHDTKPPPDRDQMALWAEPWPDGEAE